MKLTEEMNCEEMNFHRNDPTCSKLQNSDILKDLDKKLSHLDQTQRDELKMLILEYEHLFPDIPTRTDQIYLTSRVQSQLNNIHIE